MLQKIKLFFLSWTMAFMFRKDFYKESIREIEDKTLYPQGKFLNCKERATTIINNSLTRVVGFYAYAIAEHREECHEENYSEEKEELSSGLSESEITSATRGWWMP